MKNPWKDEIPELVDILGPESKPVAVTFTNREVEGIPRVRVQLCRALRLAAAGESFLIGREESASPGGSWHCGLSEAPDVTRRRFLQDFLTRSEKPTRSIVSFRHMQALGSPPPTGLSEWIFMGLVENSPVRPDIVIFLRLAEEACRLITLDHY